jgi:hypothetical protein
LDFLNKQGNNGRLAKGKQAVFCHEIIEGLPAAAFEN